ncbi:ribosomal protein large subunit protein 1 isoform b [Triangularia setosa]|uniref:Ribosomal protein large subunit protein 1 isoform b n=1 Tax=Triangularia setosa TaxID=2587417 RepID=A0AAN6W2E3_9PEZI|nr:ribosomal protein large subunit protein 1 isoform b [Podospora setosa]
MSFDDLKKLNRNKKFIKKLARKYDAFEPGLSKAGKFPTPVSHSGDLAIRTIDVKSTIRLSLRKGLCIAMAIGNVNMPTEQVVANIMITINYLVSCLKKG